MTAIALRSARQGRLRPSFFFCLLGCGFGLGLAGVALAQQAVYRCGQAYTNVPVDAGRCERLPQQTITVVPGTRAQGADPAVARAGAPAGGGTGAVQGSEAQMRRDEMARGILNAELARAQKHHAQLLAERSQGDATVQAQRQVAIERSQRDIDSLQRELARRPQPTAQP